MPDLNTKPKAMWRFWLRVAVVLCVLYFVGYVPLMDRNKPTAMGDVKDFQSSFRWAGPMLDKGGSPTKFPDTTIWNVIYEPMDKLYFRLFPRSDAEWKKLLADGYDIRNLRH